MKRQEYKLLVENWNSFLIKEDRELILENYLINEGFDKNTLKMFSIGALAVIGGNFIDINTSHANYPDAPKAGTSSTMQTSSDQLIDSQTLNDMDEASRAIIVLKSQQGYNISGGSENETRDLLMEPLSNTFGEENARIYLDDHYFVVGKASPEKMMKNALEKAKVKGIKQIDKTFMKSVTTEKSSFSGFKEIESLINNNAEKFGEAYKKHQGWSKRNLLIGNKKLSQKTLDAMVDLLEDTSKNLRAKGFNSNNIKAVGLILLGVDLEVSEIVNTLKTLNSGKTSGARLNPRLQNIIEKFSMLIDFEIASSKEYKEAIAKELFSNQEGCDAFSALRTFYKMGFGFMKKVKKAIKNVKMTSKVNRDGSTASISGNPQKADKL